MATRRNWTPEELALVLNLYCKLPFGKIHQRNIDIIKLANHLNRTPGAVAMKLVNFASLDPALSQKGLTGCSQLDCKIWNEFFINAELIERTESAAHSIYNVENDDANNDYSAEDRVATVKVRHLQSFFRKSVLTSYNWKCCITGISIPELLVASHIIPWNTNKEHRLNPCNGLCLNALHDKAFDRGIITIDKSYRVVVSKLIPRTPSNKLILDYEGHTIEIPKKFLPAHEFLDYHRNNIFHE